MTYLKQQDALESVRSSLLGDKIRNEEANNSKRNRISSLNFFHFLLYRRTSILWDLCFYIVFHDLFLNWLSRAEYACISTRNQGPRFEGIVILQKRDEHCASFQREGNRGRNKCRNCFWDRYWRQQSHNNNNNNNNYYYYYYYYYYYSFKIFLRFWLAKSTRITHHNQLLLNKFGRILSYWTDDDDEVELLVVNSQRNVLLVSRRNIV